MNYNKIIKDFLKEVRNIQHPHIVEHLIEDTTVRVIYKIEAGEFRTSIQLFDLIVFAYGKVNLN